MSQDEILRAIPHRPPMLLLDGIVEQSDEALTCHKTIRADEFFVQGHYPNFPLVPGVVLCEIAMQTGAVLLARLAADLAGVPVVTRMNNVKFKRMVRPGDTIHAAVRLTERVSQAFFLAAKVTCQGQLVVSFDFACTLAPPPTSTPESSPS